MAGGHGLLFQGHTLDLLNIPVSLVQMGHQLWLLYFASPELVVLCGQLLDVWGPGTCCYNNYILRWESSKGSLKIE